MTTVEKQIEECRQSMRKLELYRYIRMGAINIILEFQNAGFFPKKPQVLKEKRMSDRQNKDMWQATIIENCLKNPTFLESFMIGEELVAFWKTKTVKGKEYHDLDLVPRRFTKTFTVKTGYPLEENEVTE